MGRNNFCHIRNNGRLESDYQYIYAESIILRALVIHNFHENTDALVLITIQDLSNTFVLGAVA